MYELLLPLPLPHCLYKMPSGCDITFLMHDWFCFPPRCQPGHHLAFFWPFHNNHEPLGKTRRHGAAQNHIPPVGTLFMT